MKVELKLLWAFSDGDRWVTLATGEGEKALHEIERIAEIETQKNQWGNYSFGVRVLKDGKIYSEFEI
jgi:hypothetical protein